MYGVMYPVVHAVGSESRALKGVQDGPVIWAHVECDEVSGPIVPRPTACGDGGDSGIPKGGGMSGVGPPRGGLSQAEDLVNLWLPQ